MAEIKFECGYLVQSEFQFTKFTVFLSLTDQTLDLVVNGPYKIYNQQNQNTLPAKHHRLKYPILLN